MCDFVLFHANLMHAAIRRHLVPRFKHLLKEGLVYSLKNVKVSPNTNQYRPLASDKRLLFLATTKVVELDEDVVAIPKYGFQFVDLPMLESRADNMNTLSGFYDRIPFKFSEKATLISLPSVTSTVTLWGKLGEMFDPTLYIGDDAPYVIVVSSVTVKTYQRALTFSSTSATKIYVNPGVDHVSSIRERFAALPPKVITIEATTSARLPPEEAMFVNRMNVETLVRATCAGELKVDVITLKATMIAINNRFKWYYMSCKACVKKATLQDGVFICNSCRKPVDQPLAMFCINVQVADGTGTTTVVLLNSIAERLLDTSANKIINKIPPGDDTVPRELQELLGREYVFKLKLNKYNLVDGLQDYGVSSIFTPVQDLETAYKNKMLEQATPGMMTSSSSSVPESSNQRKRKLSPVIQDQALDS
ncbi:replication protein A 70 kDa DNA-binding subunit D-like [Apium graveolens]|uniref:replication protein A 70 kDa DNA-binding subunit D-like n=1 Tax=Apium graveolens TaxID=4045 RepID=UPI003D79FA5A